MGSLTQKYGNVAPPPSPAPRPVQQGGMMRSGGSIGPTGPRINFTDPSASALEASQRTTATEAAKRAAQQKADQELLQTMTSVGKPYSELTLDDAINVFGGNLSTAKQFIDLKKSFNETDTTKKKINMVVPIVDQIIKMADSIPSAEGLTGRALQATNWVSGQAGYNPEMTTINNMIKMIRPMIVKAMGDSGNLNIQEQKTGVAVLEQIPSGTTKERALGIKMFKMIMEKAAGKSWNKIVGEAPKVTEKDLDDDDLILMLQGMMKKK